MRASIFTVLFCLLNGSFFRTLAESGRQIMADEWERAVREFWPAH